MLSFKEKLSYGIGRLGSSITMDMADLFTGYVYFAFFGLEENPFLAFLGVALGKIVIAFSSYLSGYVSDRTNTKWGRRKPFIIIGAPLLAIAFFLLYSPHLFLPPNSDPGLIFGYLLLFNSLYQGLYGFLLTPFQSWMPEITVEQERLEISGYQNTVNLVAFLIGAGSAFILPAILGGKSEEIDLLAPNSLLPFLSNGLVITLFIAIFALAVVIFFVPSVIIIKAKEVFIPKPSFIEELRVVISNKNYIMWTFSRGFLSVALSIIMGIVLSWIDKALQFGTIEYLLFGITLLGTIFVGFIWWIKFGNRNGKTRSFIVAMLWMAFFMPLTFIVGQIPLFSSILPLGADLDVLLQALLFVILVGIGVSGFYILPYPIVADIVEEDERRTGESRAGIYYGFESIPLNFFQFCGYLVVGFLLENLPVITDWRGFEYSQGFILWGPISVVFILFSVLIFWRFVDADPLREK
ncbi:MAG: MFS transporter [Candidatus Hodarchaeales archaeon]